MKKIIFSFIAIVSLTSCSDLQKKDQLAEIESMNLSLDSLDAVLIEKTIDSLSAMTLTTTGVELRIKNFYKVDTIDLEFGKKMDAYKVMRRNLSAFGKQQSKLKQSIVEERENLNNLSTDITNGSGEKDKYNEYLEFEQQNVATIRVLASDFTFLHDTVMSTYNQLHDEINAYSFKLAEQDKK